MKNLVIFLIVMGAVWAGLRYLGVSEVSDLSKLSEISEGVELPVFSAEPKRRSWTSASGAVVEATFVRREGAVVFLKKSEGKMSRISLKSLSAADQKYVEKRTPSVAGGGEASAKLRGLFGGSLYTANRGAVSTGRLNGKVIGVYFSASWCPPCRKFTPSLVKAYHELKRSGKPFEVVLVSSDKSEREAFSYMKEHDMPWLTVKYKGAAHQTLRQKYGSTGIPHLVIISDSGEVLSRDGWGEVSSKGAGAFAQWK